MRRGRPRTGLLPGGRGRASGGLRCGLSSAGSSVAEGGVCGYHLDTELRFHLVSEYTEGRFRLSTKAVEGRSGEAGAAVVPRSSGEAGAAVVPRARGEAGAVAAPRAPGEAGAAVVPRSSGEAGAAATTDE